MLTSLANGWRKGSAAAQCRQARSELFRRAIEPLAPPVRVLDIGGQPEFWEALDFPGIGTTIHISFVNLFPVQSKLPGSRAFTGDARHLREIDSGAYDVAFSNSVIEHVGGFRDQLAMASECRRVARSYFVQTPNRFFPLEPHFLFPFFQFLPRTLRARLHASRNWGWWSKAPGFYEALAEVESIRLMTAGELKFAFPDGTLWRERVGPLVKSHVILSPDLARNAGLVPPHPPTENTVPQEEIDDEETRSLRGSNPQPPP